MSASGFIAFGIELDNDILYETGYPWGDSIYDWDLTEWWQSLGEGPSEGESPFSIEHAGYTQDTDQINAVLCIKASVIRGDWEGLVTVDPRHFTKAENIENDKFSELLNMINEHTGKENTPKWFFGVSSDRG